VCVLVNILVINCIIIVSIIISGPCILLVSLYIINRGSVDQLIVTLVNETVNWVVCSADIECCRALMLRHCQRFKLYGLGPDLLAQQ
jgi:hypothetical protein